MKYSGETETHEFNQTSTGFVNKVRYFGLEIDDGKFYVVFDDKKDEENAKFIRQTNTAEDFEDVVGDVLFVLAAFIAVVIISVMFRVTLTRIVSNLASYANNMTQFF